MRDPVIKILYIITVNGENDGWMEGGRKGGVVFDISDQLQSLPPLLPPPPSPHLTPHLLPHLFSPLSPPPPSIIELGIYPAVDPLDSSSRIIDPNIVGEENYTVTRSVQKILQVK